MSQRWFPTPQEGARPCETNRDSGAERLTKSTWKPTSHRTHCVTICGGAISRRRRPNSMPPRDDERPGEVPAGGGFTPAPDGGNEQHPIHDEDQEDATPDDYEREIDRLDAATRAR